MVTINKITTPRYLYNQDGFVGTCETYAEVLDAQIQIAENKLEGYYFLENDVKLLIKSNGEFERFPRGFDIIYMQLIYLMKVRTGRPIDSNWKDYCKIEPK